MKKFLSVLLAAALLLTLFSAHVFAASHTHNGITFTGVSALPAKAGNYYLTKDISLSSTWTVPAGKVRLCLNGHSITLTASSGSVIEVPEGASLTVYDENDKGRITGGKGNEEGKKGGGVFVAGSFTLEGGCVSGNTAEIYGGGVFVDDDASFVMNGGVISENGANYDGGVQVWGTFTLNGGEIRDNTECGVDVSGSFVMNGGTVSGHAGRGVVLSFGEMEMTGGSVQDNTGGGIYVAGELEMSGGSITGNGSTSINGGGIGGNSSDTGAWVTITGGTISGNTAKYGGGVYLENDFSGSRFEMTNGTISGNSAREQGGGVCLRHDPYASMGSVGGVISGGTVKNNTVRYCGGGISLRGCTFEMNGGTVSGNTADSFGGGVYATEGCTFTMNGGTVSRNTSTNSSGGGLVIAYSGSSFIMNGGSVTGNASQIFGGGVMLDQFAQCSLNGGSITGNRCTADSDNYGGGGGVFADSSVSLSVSGGLRITDNTFNGKLNDLYLEEGRTVTVAGALTEEASIGIKTEAVPGSGGLAVTSGLSRNGYDASPFFADDDENYSVVYSSAKKEAVLTARTGPAITSLTNEDTAGGVTVTWAAVAGAEKYRLQRSADGGMWLTLTENETGTSYTDTDASVMGSVYAYRLSAYAGGAWTDNSVKKSIRRNPFTDVAEDANYFNYVAWGVNNRIVNGTSTTTFSPQNNCTRAQFCVLLYKMAGKPPVSGKTPFTDIGGLSGNVKKAVIWAYQQGIINGTSKTTFSPDGNVTRAQVVIMLYKLAGKPKVSGSTNFTDIGGMTANVQKAILWANKNGIVRGTGETTFSPNDACTRAQLVIMLYRYDSKF